VLTWPVPLSRTSLQQPQLAEAVEKKCQREDVARPAHQAHHDAEQDKGQLNRPAKKMAALVLSRGILRFLSKNADICSLNTQLIIRSRVFYCQRQRCIG